MSTNGSAAHDGLVLLEARHVDDLKGAVQALTRMTAEHVDVGRKNLAATKSLETAVNRLSDLLAGAAPHLDTPGGRRKK